MASAGTRRARSSHAPIPRLVGRERELAQLEALLGSERLLTLTGAPGIGKSRLAIELMTEVAGGYPDGARLVELATADRPVGVPRALASALAVDEVSGEGLIDTITRRIGGRRMLVVLDNCEHLLGACAKLAERLLEVCPELRLLATSRERLRVDVETVWELDPLAVAAPEEEDAPPERLLAYPAVALFVERAGAVQPGFSLNAHVAPAVVEICRRLDGIPLAIELAAARVELLTPAEIARRLDDRFDLLTGGSPGVAARHQTLRAALDWSHQLLATDEQTLLHRLSVFVGGFDLELCATICAGEGVERGEVDRLLERLVSRALLVVDAPGGRYRLLETIRAYAGERLEEAGEAGALREGHARSYLALAEEAEPQLAGPRQQDWFVRLEAERANLRSALEWQLGHGEGAAALRLVGSLVLFWRVRCHFGEGRELLKAALSAGDAAPPALRARALWGVAFMALMVGDIERAIPAVEQSLAIFRELDDRQGCARALLILGNCRQFSDGLSGLPALEESAAEARKAGDAWCLAHALAIAGSEYIYRSELISARPLFEECLRVARAADDKQGILKGLKGLGAAALHQDEFGFAQSLFEEALSVTSELGEDYDKATTLEALAELAILRGDHGGAARLLDEALGLIADGDDRLARPRVLARHAGVARAQGDRARARLLFEEALAPAGGGSGTPVTALQGLGELAADEGDPLIARRLFERALELARARGQKAAAAHALHSLGQLARAQKEPGRAAALELEALELRHEIGSAHRIAGSLQALGGLAADAGDHTRAARLLGVAKALSDKDGYVSSSWDPSHFEADLALVREALSEKDFQLAFAQGAALSLDEAVAQAFRSRGIGGKPVGGWGRLTDREREVAGLAADGLTNPEIAERLFITFGTAKTHLSNIFAKLEMTGRRELRDEIQRLRRHGHSDV